MRNFVWTFCLLSLAFSTSAQSTLKVSIDSITTDDSHSLRRKYNIHYHIENRTDKPLSFFLHPHTLIANAASSMTLFAVYKIYQNDEFQDMDGPFFPNVPEAAQLDNFPNHNTPEAREFIKKTNEKYKAEYDAMIANYHQNGGKSTDEKWIIRNQKLLRSKMTLQPHQKQPFVILTTWDRIRVVNNGDLEYYLNEKDAFEIEIVLDLKKTLFKTDLSETEFAKIKNDATFIEGIFTSNKMRINFGE
ncbi:hypothetical protein [Flavobacterium sp.]|uniref:hypothetical protein n=1 Tax=Flavobacterium sp. TaxID=239 RepID=UPI0039E3F743